MEDPAKTTTEIPTIDIQPKKTTSIATAENVSDRELLQLLRKFCVDTFDPAGNLQKTTKAKIALTLDATNDKDIIQKGLPIDNSTNVRENERQAFQDFSEDIQLNFLKIKKLISEGHVVISRADGEIIGAMAAKKHGKMPDGRDIYEITQAIVLPDFRGQHVGHGLVASLIATIRLSTENQNSPIMSVSKTPEMNGICKKYGFKEKPMDFLYEIVSETPGTIPWIEDKKNKPDWKVYLMDPLD